MALFSRNRKKEETLTRPKNSQGRISVPSNEPHLQRIGWLGLKVSDVVGEALFLEEKLHLQARTEGNGTGGHQVTYDCDTLQLELAEGGQTWATRARPRKGNPDISLIASFAVDHIEQISQQLAEAEIATTQIYEQGWAASFLFFDPERTLWQVSETRNAPAVGFSELKRIGALWLAVEDLPEQIKFYRDVLNLPLSDVNNRARPITEAAEHQQSEEDEKGELAEGVESEFEIDRSVLAPHPVFSADADSDTASFGDSVTFFDEGARLVLTTGGHRVEGRAEKQWGIDTAFMIGFQTNNLAGYHEKLKQAGVKTQGPFRAGFNSNPNSYNNQRPGQAIRFTDPEGNVWQIYE